MKDSPPPTSALDVRHSTFVIPLVAGIGNALMAEPMIRQLREALPDARVVAMAISNPIAEVARRIAGVEVHVTGSGLKKLLAGVRRTRAIGPDVYLVPFPSNRWQYNVMARASGARRVVIHGYPIGAVSALGFLHRDRVPATRGIHDVDQNLRLLAPLGITPRLMDAPRFPLADDDRASASDLLRQARVDPPYVIVHAGSARTILAEAKRWPEDRYAKLVESIRDQSALHVVVVEGPDEAGVADRILAHVRDRARITALPLRGNLGVAGALLERSAFYVGTDSGLAHLAAAVGRRAVTLFAPADPDRVCPFANRDLVVQPPGLSQLAFLYPWESTKPKMRPGQVDQIKNVRVEQVMEKVMPLAVAAEREQPA
jgi:ADP-heptose:LPS heptosyltransferase